MSNFRQLAWDIDCLRDNEVVRRKEFGMTREAKSVRYPIRLLRYWFMYHLLREECLRLGRPLEVCEVGVDVGQMLEFARSVSETSPGLRWRRWQAVDAVLKEDRLRAAGYADFSLQNIEDDAFRLETDWDAVIVLHVLEHLFDPEAAVVKLAAGLAPGGVLIGGFPGIPEMLVPSRQRSVRRRARPMGHVSVFSPQRVRRMGEAAGLSTEFLSGAFFMRSKGSPLENTPWWMRFNLAWGGAFPSWPGEIYWLMRKP